MNRAHFVMALVMSLTSLATMACDENPLPPDDGAGGAGGEAPLDCEVDALRCTADDRVEICIDGESWLDRGPCPAGSACEAGRCVEQGCGADCEEPPPMCEDDVCRGSHWASLPPLPIAVSHAAGGAIDDESMLLVAGGRQGDRVSGDSWLFEDDAWRPLPPLALPRAEAAYTTDSGTHRFKVYGGLTAVGPTTAASEIRTRPGRAGDDPPEWVELNPMNVARHGAAAARLDGFDYVFGGRGNGEIVLDVVERAPDGGRWMVGLAPMPRPRYGHVAVTAVDRIFIIGGEGPDGRLISAVDIYVPADDVWLEGPDLPTPRVFATAAFNTNVGSVRGQARSILVAGGRGEDGQASAAVEALDLDASTWRVLRVLPRPRHGAAGGAFTWRVALGNPVDRRSLGLVMLGGVGDEGRATAADVLSLDLDYLRREAPLPAARTGHGAAVTGDRIFVVGGQSTDGGNPPTWAYDPETGGVDLHPSLPATRDEAAVVALGGAVYALGGADEQGRATADVRRYDPATGRWVDRRPMLAARRAAAAVAIDGHIWVMGGIDGVPLSAVERYTPGADTWEPMSPLPRPTAYAAAAVFDGQPMVVGGQNADRSIADIVVIEGARWRSRGLLPEPLSRPHVAVIGDRLAVFGGADADGPTDALYTATLPGFTPGAPRSPGREIFSPRAGGATVQHGGRIYLIGGEGPDPRSIDSLRARCFDGVRNGRESWIDHSDGCPPAVHVDVPERGNVQLSPRHFQPDVHLFGDGVRHTIRVHDGREWKAQCAPGWGNVDATVACRQFFGPGTTGESIVRPHGLDGPIWSLWPICRGDEQSILDCRRNDQGGAACLSFEIIDVICHAP